MSIQASGKHHFVTLDGMRGIAAIFVGCLHAFQLLIKPNALFFHTYLAVDFFFCLSGFVVAYAYEARLQDDMTFYDFCIRRLIRLYPMIFVGAALGGSVWMLGPRDSYAVDSIIAASAFLLLPAGLLRGREAYPSNNPMWSLFFELLANFVYAGTVRISTRLLTLALIPAAALLTLVSIANNGLAHIGFEDVFSFLEGLVRVAYPFLAGVLLYRFRIFEHDRTWPALAPIAILVATLLMPSGFGGWVDVMAVLILFPIVVGLGSNTAPSSLTSILKFLGEVSYPFYVIHQPIMRVLKNMPHAGQIASFNVWILPSLAILLSIAAAYAFFWIFDKPARAFLTQRLAGSPLQRGAA